MRACQAVKQVPGRRTTSAHDRACLYVRRRAEEFIQRVRPVDGGYCDVYTELERRLYQDNRVASYVDLVITAFPRETVTQHQKFFDEHPESYLGQTRDQPFEGSREAFFVEVKPWRESIGDLLRQFKYYMHLWDVAKADELTTAAVRTEFEYLSNRYLGKEVSWLPKTAYWVLATVYKPTDEERQIFKDAGIIVTELAAHRINGDLP